MLHLIPSEISFELFLILLAVSSGASCITVIAGIGGGGILLAIFASILPPAALIPVHGAIQLGSNLGRSALMLREMYWPAFPAFALGTVVGASMGGVLVINLDPAWVQIGVGGFIVYSVLGYVPELVRRWGLLTGLISSFLTMFFGATGLFVAAFTKSFDLPRHAHVAVHGTLMTLQHGLKTLVFVAVGFAFGPWLFFILAMIAAGFLGTLVGKRLLGQITDARFKLFLNTVLLLLALRLIWAGLSDLDIFG